MNAVLHFRMSRRKRRGRLPKCLMLYIDPASWGHVAEWLRNGLQNCGQGRRRTRCCHA
jgi:hypothetical protein